MPATPINTLAAVVLASTVPVDSDIGIRNSMSGLIINSVEFDAGRDEKEKMNHRGVNVIDILSNPHYALVVDAEITQVSGTFVNRHPGEAIDRATVLEFRADTGAGWQGITDGWFRFKEPKQGARQADLNTYKFSLKLMGTYQNTVSVVTGA